MERTATGNLENLPSDFYWNVSKINWLDFNGQGHCDPTKHVLTITHAMCNYSDFMTPDEQTSLNGWGWRQLSGSDFQLICLKPHREPLFPPSQLVETNELMRLGAVKERWRFFTGSEMRILISGLSVSPRLSPSDSSLHDHDTESVNQFVINQFSTETN